MEKELDREFTIEPWLSQIIRESHDMKFDNVPNEFKRFVPIIGKKLLKTSWRPWILKLLTICFLEV